MVWTPRKKAAVFSILLLTVSGAFVVSAAASTQGVLAPFTSGEDYGDERPLSRHGVALAVIVGLFTESGVERVEGATVRVYALSGEHGAPQRGELLAEQTTDDHGRAIFQLRRGPVDVEVLQGSFSAHHMMRLPQSMRVGVAFDEAGNAEWHELNHRDLERHGDHRMLLVRLVDTSQGERTPIQGVTVTVYPGEDADAAASTTTGPRGAATFQLRPGTYRVDVAWEDRSASATIEFGGMGRLVFAVGEDEITSHYQEGHADAHPTRASHERAAEHHA